MAKAEENATMTKAAFTALLKEKGYTLDTQTSGVPAVICDTADIKKVSDEIRALAEGSGYPGSFGVRGNSAMPEQTADSEPSADDIPVNYDGENNDEDAEEPDRDDSSDSTDDYVQLSLF